MPRHGAQPISGANRRWVEEHNTRFTDMTVGCLYVLYDEVAQLAKIGLTTGTAGKRQRSIMGAHGTVLVNLLNASVADCEAAEAQCHAHFAAKRRNGEWFAVPFDEVLLYVWEHVEWAEFDLENQGRLAWYLLFAKQGDHSRMREVVKRPGVRGARPGL